MRHTLATCCLALLAALPADAQITGHVEAPELGVSFDLPAGWEAHENNGTWDVGNGEVAGAIMVTTHPHTGLGDLERDMLNVTSEDPGNRMERIGKAQHPRPGTVLMEFQGMLEWRPWHVLGIGSVSAQGGRGLSIMAIAPGTDMDPALREAALAIMHSTRYSTPVIPDLVTQWRQHLTGTRLTLISSYSSMPGTEGGIAGGVSSQRIIDLCPQGVYRAGGRADLTLSGAEASAWSASKDAEQGRWEVSATDPSAVQLVLRADNGGERTYRLEDRNGATYLNGERWFRTTADDGEHAPRCDP
jgi:hypothetical protein